MTDLHPEIAAHLAKMKAAGFPAMDSLTPDRLRDLIAAAPRASAPDMAQVKDLSIGVAGGTIGLRLYVPEGVPVALIDFMHGGGWTMGNLDQSDVACRYLALATSCVVVSVDYRLAPEYPFPTAVEDAFAALTWIAAHRREVSADNLPLFVAGDSAGANLAAVACILARDRGGPDIAGQVLLVPSTDGDIDAPELTAFEAPFLRLSEISWFFDQYIPDRQQRRDARFSPLRAESHADLPPCLIVTAEHDVLRYQGEAYGRALAEAGVPTTACRYPGTTHSFITVNPTFESSKRALSDIAAFITGQAGRR